MGIADGELTSMALCWRLERTDGAGIALTSHDQTLSKGGARFEPNPGMVPAAVSRSLGLDPDTGELAGALSANALEPGDLGVGRWDGSAVELSAVDWSDPVAEGIVLLAGELGGVSIDGDS